MSGQNESAGKRRRSRLRKGAPWLKTMLVQCAWAAKRAKDSYYRAQFFRLQAKLNLLVRQLKKLGFEATLQPIARSRLEPNPE